MAKKEDVTGRTFGKLTALSPAPTRNKRTFWLWRCECGAEKEINLPHVKAGKIVSCGCYLSSVLRSEEHRQHCVSAAKMPRSHGLSRIPEYYVWKTMRQRCKNPNQHDYRWYGALGVSVCERWNSFESFYSDMGPSYGLTLDRINPFGDYEPSNCRWATWETQRKNKRANA